jgi:hypothetical protein
MFFSKEEKNMQRLPKRHHDMAFYVGLNAALACAIAASLWLWA